MAVKANQQRHKGCVDELEPQVALDDVIDSLLIGSGLFDNVFQYGLGHGTCSQPQNTKGQQVDIGHPLPCFEAERLEDCKCQHGEHGADEREVSDEPFKCKPLINGTDPGEKGGDNEVDYMLWIFIIVAGVLLIIITIIICIKCCHNKSDDVIDEITTELMDKEEIIN